MHDAHAIRKIADLEKLKALQSRIPKTLEVTAVRGDPPRTISCRIRIPTAKNADYPRSRQEISEVEIQFSEGYPLQPPLVTFKTPIWNPNVYTSGKWCFGDWKVTENLELFVARLMKVIALDPTIINPRSAANAEAARWYVQVQGRQPDLFPTVSVAGLVGTVEAPRIAWRNVK